MILNGRHSQYDFKIPKEQFKLNFGQSKNKDEVV